MNKPFNRILAILFSCSVAGPIPIAVHPAYADVCLAESMIPTTFFIFSSQAMQVGSPFFTQPVMAVDASKQITAEIAHGVYVPSWRSERKSPLQLIVSHELTRDLEAIRKIFLGTSIGERVEVNLGGETDFRFGPDHMTFTLSLGSFKRGQHLSELSTVLERLEDIPGWPDLKPTAPDAVTGKMVDEAILSAARFSIGEGPSRWVRVADQLRSAGLLMNLDMDTRIREVSGMIELDATFRPRQKWEETEWMKMAQMLASTLNIRGLASYGWYLQMQTDRLAAAPVTATRQMVRAGAPLSLMELVDPQGSVIQLAMQAHTFPGLVILGRDRLENGVIREIEALEAWSERGLLPAQRMLARGTLAATEANELFILREEAIHADDLFRDARARHRLGVPLSSEQVGQEIFGKDVLSPFVKAVASAVLELRTYFTEEDLFKIFATEAHVAAIHLLESPTPSMLQKTLFQLRSTTHNSVSLPHQLAAIATLQIYEMLFWIEQHQSDALPEANARQRMIDEMNPQILWEQTDRLSGRSA